MNRMHPKIMDRTVGDGPSGRSFSLTKAGPKRMPRMEGHPKITDVGRKGEPVSLTYTNWRAKNRPDPKEVEYKKMMSSMGFANL